MLVWIRCLPVCLLAWALICCCFNDSQISKKNQLKESFGIFRPCLHATFCTIIIVFYFVFNPRFIDLHLPSARNNYSMVLRLCVELPACSSRSFSHASVINAGWSVLHCKKSFSIFPSPAGMSLTKLSLGGNNLYMTSLFPPRKSLVIDIPAGDGNIKKLFLQCGHSIAYVAHFVFLRNV